MGICSSEIDHKNGLPPIEKSSQVFRQNSQDPKFIHGLNVSALSLRRNNSSGNQMPQFVRKPRSLSLGQLELEETVISERNSSQYSPSRIKSITPRLEGKTEEYSLKTVSFGAILEELSQPKSSHSEELSQPPPTRAKAPSFESSLELSSTPSYKLQLDSDSSRSFYRSNTPIERSRDNTPSLSHSASSHSASSHSASSHSASSNNINYSLNASNSLIVTPSTDNSSKDTNTRLNELNDQRKIITQRYSDMYEKHKVGLNPSDKELLKKELRGQMKEELASIEEEIAKLTPDAARSSSGNRHPRYHKRSQSVIDTVSDMPPEYELGERIGVGSFAKVFLCYHKVTKEKVAIKVIQTSLVEKTQIEKILQEVQIMRKLMHPNIVRLIATYEGKKRLFIVMEYVRGCSVAKLCNDYFQNGAPEVLVRHIIRQALLGLRYLHKLGLAHRDFKLENMLIDLKTLNVKLCDFGSAKEFLSDCKRTAFYAFTPLYVAPEVLLEEPYTLSVDIWAIGCAIIQLISGKLPWDEHDFTNLFTAQIYIASHDELPKFPDNLSPTAEDFLLQCLVRDPSRRATTDELLNHYWLQNIEPVTSSIIPKNKHWEYQEEDKLPKPSSRSGANLYS